MTNGFWKPIFCHDPNIIKKRTQSKINGKDSLKYVVYPRESVVSALSVFHKSK